MAWMQSFSFISRLLLWFLGLFGLLFILFPFHFSSSFFSEYFLFFHIKIIWKAEEHQTSCYQMNDLYQDIPTLTCHGLSFFLFWGLLNQREGAEQDISFLHTRKMKDTFLPSFFHIFLDFHSYSFVKIIILMSFRIRSGQVYFYSSIFILTFES